MSATLEKEHSASPGDVDEKQHEVRAENSTPRDLVYEGVDEEPEFTARTWIALASLFILNLVQVIALTGPPAILSYIGEDLKNPGAQTWVPNALSLVQAVGGPVIAFASDTFQARKIFLVGLCSVSFIGAAIAPGSSNIYRVIVAQILIGAGFAAVPLAYCIPSEIVPRRWRPLAQSLINIAAAIGAGLSPIVCGALTKRNVHTGWRNFYWFQMALWGFCVVGIVVGYKPPKRTSHLEGLTLGQKIQRLDLPGMLILAAGLTLLLTGLSLGGAWTSAKVLGTLVSGIVGLICFGLYQWKGTSTGILHHDLFRGGATFPICIALIFIEGILLFSIIVFYPALTTALYETDPLLSSARTSPFWICAGLSTIAYGLWSSKAKTIKAPMAVGFLLFTCGIAGLAAIRPDTSTMAIAMQGLAGLGFGGPLILIITGVQLSTPHHLIATGTAVVTSTRAVAASTFTAIYAAALNDRLAIKIPSYVASAAVGAGLPESSLPAFIPAIAGNMPDQLASIPGATGEVVQAAVAGLMRALADSFRIIFIIAAPFGALGVAMCYFIGDLSDKMDYQVDAPVEELHARRHTDREV